MLIPSFFLDSESIKTALYASSVPVPVVEGIAITGIEGFKFLGKPLYFKPLPEFFSKVATPFAKSIALPPPIATKQSNLWYPFFLNSFVARSKCW